jgi:hypothetical protein
MGCALVALLLVVELCPEGMPGRFRRPLHERLAEELWTREAPMHPGLLPAACSDWCAARIFVQFGGRGITCALFAKGDEEAGGEDRSSTWEGWEEGKVGMALGTWPLQEYPDMLGRRTMKRPWKQTIKRRGGCGSALELRAVWEGDQREAKVRTGLGKAHRPGSQGGLWKRGPWWN